MGLLDDAIREHLELKRAHGASEEELEKAETEALGPARREPAAEAAALDEAAAEPPPPPPPDDAGDYEPEPLVEEQEEEEEEPMAPPPPFAEDDELAAPAPALEPQSYEEVEDELALPEEPVAHPPLESTQEFNVLENDDFAEEEDALPEAEETVPPGGAGLHGDAVLDDELEPDEVPSDERLDQPPPHDDPYRARTSVLDEPLDEGPEPDEGEDVLEETPEFLQDTPEHDKLWFEQKPPRDFDFD